MDGKGSLGLDVDAILNQTDVLCVYVFGGLYDPWAPGGGDVRLVSSPTLVPSGPS
jgi:hypothetical protein